MGKYNDLAYIGLNKGAWISIGEIDFKTMQWKCLQSMTPRHKWKRWARLKAEKPIIIR